MVNAKTDHSKKLRAATAKAAMRKKLADPKYKRITIGGDAHIIDRFVSKLNETEKNTRIEQLAALLDKLDNPPDN